MIANVVVVVDVMVSVAPVRVVVIASNPAVIAAPPHRLLQLSRPEPFNH